MPFKTESNLYRSLDTVVYRTVIRKTYLYRCEVIVEHYTIKTYLIV